MKKNTSKLGVKKETLQSLSPDELGNANGGSYIYFNRYSLVAAGVVRAPIPPAPPPGGHEYIIRY